MFIKPGNVFTDSAIHKASGSAPAPEPPENTVAPVISGTVIEGNTLSCTTGTWTGDAVITYTYQWKRDGSSIGGATSSTYDLAYEDVGSDITCVVTGTNDVDSASATSNELGPVLFNPEVYGDLGLQLKADAGVTKDGSDLVSLWANQAASGSNYDFEQATGGNKFTWVNAAQNGLPVMRLNGTSSFMSIKSAGRDLLKNLGGATLFMVWKSALTGVKQTAFFARDSQAGGFYGHLALARAVNLQDVAQAERVSNVGTTTVTADSYAGVAMQVNTVIADYTNTNLYLYRDGNLVASNESFETAGSTTNSNAVDIVIGRYPQNANEYVNGDICEILIYLDVLNSTNRERVETYLKDKCGVATKQRLVFWGDSIVSGNALSVAQSFPAQMITQLDDIYYWQNEAVNGHQIWQQKDKANAAGGAYVRTYPSNEPEPWLIGACGGNDMMAGASIATTYGRLKTMVSEGAATSKFGRICVATLIPGVNSATTDALAPYNVSNIVPGMAGGGDLLAAGATHLARPDLVAHFDTNTAMNDVLFYQGDKLHPTALGNTLLPAAYISGLGI